MGDSPSDRGVLQARVGDLEQRVRELEEELRGQEQREEEVIELRAIVEAQEVAIREQREIIESQSALIEDLNAHLMNAPEALEENRPPLPPARSSGWAKSRAQAPSSAPAGLGSVRKEKSEPSQREKRQGALVILEFCMFFCEVLVIIT